MSRWLLCALLATACLPTVPRTETPEALPRTTVKYERMALFMESEGLARLRGFDGAAPEGYVIAVVRQSDSGQAAQATADAQGRFDVRFAATLDEEFELQPALGDERATPLKFRARSVESALPMMMRGRVAGTGSTPNQLVIDGRAPAAGETHGLVVLSGDNALQPMDFDTGRRFADLAVLPEVPTTTGIRSATPWNAFFLGDQAWVTRYAQGGVSLVTVSRGTVESSWDPSAPVPLGMTITLDPAVDADGNGAPERQADQLLPRGPTGITVAGSRVVVAYSNVLSTDGAGRAQYGPGMIVSLGIDAEGRFTGDVRTALTAFANPQHVIALSGGTRVVVASSGGLQRINGTWTAESEGGVEVYDVDSLQRVQSYNLGTFAPTRPLLLSDGRTIYVPSVLQARIARIDLVDGVVERGPGGEAPAIELEATNALRTTFECALHPTGIAMCAMFDTDSVTFVDTADDSVRPWPFIEDISVVEPGTTARVGPQSMVVRPGRNGVDRTGADVFVLLSLASRVVGLDSRFVLGP